jgi:hypothetical protein
MAKTVGLVLHTQRIWRANRLQPHRLRTFKRSTDAALAEKVEDIVGLYLYLPFMSVYSLLISSSPRRPCRAMPWRWRSTPRNHLPIRL